METKPALKSSTVLGSIGGILAGGSSILGFLPPVFLPYVTFAVGVWTLVGRLKAETKIKGVVNGSGSTY